MLLYGGILSPFHVEHQSPRKKKYEGNKKGSQGTESVECKASQEIRLLRMGEPLRFVG